MIIFSLQQGILISNQKVSQQDIFITKFNGRDEKQKVINLQGLF